MTKATMRYICSSVMVLLLAALLGASPALSASLLPPGKNCFYDAAGASLSAGTVEFYVPGTMSPKDTWQDAAQLTLNTNPVQLDAAGCALIYGNGTYRQIVKDSNGNTMWDQPTSSGTSISASWGGTSTGSANAQAVALDDFDLSDGQVVNFLAGFSNTTAMTLNVNSTGPVPVVRDSGAGPLILTGGEIVVGNVVSVLYVAATGQFHILTPTPLQAIDGAVFFTGVLTPTILASDQNDWTPPGNYSSANTLRVSSNVAITITGLTGGAAGRTLFVHNVGSFSITLSPNSSASAASNRFGFPTPVVLSANDSVTLQYDAVSSQWRNVSPATATFQPGLIFGCSMANNVTDAANDLDIAACQAAATNAVVDQRGSAMTKRLDALWVAGTSQGMRSSASLVDGTWHIFAISRPDGYTDYFAHDSLDPTSALPTGFLYYRRIGSVIRASSSIRQFTQEGDWFRWKSPVLEANVTNLGTTAVSFTMTAPQGFGCEVLLNVIMSNSSANTYVYVRNPSDSDLVPDVSSAPLAAPGLATSSAIAMQLSVWTNASAQIQARANQGATTFRTSTIAYRDTRGRDGQ